MSVKIFIDLSENENENQTLPTFDNQPSRVNSKKLKIETEPEPEPQPEYFPEPEVFPESKIYVHKLRNIPDSGPQNFKIREETTLYLIKFDLERMKSFFENKIFFNNIDLANAFVNTFNAMIKGYADEECDLLETKNILGKEVPVTLPSPGISVERITASKLIKSGLSIEYINKAYNTWNSNLAIDHFVEPYLCESEARKLYEVPRPLENCGCDEDDALSCIAYCRGVKIYENNDSGSKDKNSSEEEGKGKGEKYKPEVCGRPVCKDCFVKCRICKSLICSGDPISSCSKECPECHYTFCKLCYKGDSTKSAKEGEEVLRPIEDECDICKYEADGDDEFVPCFECEKVMMCECGCGQKGCVSEHWEECENCGKGFIDGHHEECE